MFHNYQNFEDMKHEKLLERIDHMIYQMKYPPLNGGPDKEEIIDMLWACYNAQDNDEDHKDEADDLNDILDDAIRDLERLIDSLKARRNG